MPKGRSSLFGEPVLAYKAYDWDVKLLKKLGLPLKLPISAPVDEHGFHVLGTVPADAEVGRSTVEVGVQCWPAQFWRFVVKGDAADTHEAVVETGSGAFEDYWPSVELLAKGMLHVKWVGL